MAYRRSWQRDFDRSIRENPNWPVVVSQGDSWFSYPHEKNVVDFLDEPLSGRDAPNKKGKDASQRDWSLLRLERMQDEILGVMTGGERAFLNEILHRYEVDALLFSAGGNDLLGPDLGALLQPFRSGMTAADAVVEGRLGRRLRQIEDCYRELIDMVLDDGADLKVLVNSYDLPLPSCEEARLPAGAAWPVAAPGLRRQGVSDRESARARDPETPPRPLLSAARPAGERGADTLPSRRDPRRRGQRMGRRDPPQLPRRTGGRRALREDPAALRDCSEKPRRGAGPYPARRPARELRAPVAREKYQPGRPARSSPTNSGRQLPSAAARTA
jgi:hypothetical protein